MKPALNPKWLAALCGLTIAVLLGPSFRPASPPWGFFGHRKINQLAVFTLPPEMIGFYKKNIGFVTEHAVDADKRRYASRFEAVRHYIDLDQWGRPPFRDLPRDWTDALMTHTDLYVVVQPGDTVLLFGAGTTTFTDRHLVQQGKTSRRFFGKDGDTLRRWPYRQFFIHNVLPLYYEDDWQVQPDSLRALFAQWKRPFPECQSAFAVDRLSPHGILPYNLVQMQHRLTEAFRRRDANAILRLSADMGHYIADAHVPLHTTSNYNGQLTDQVGIHAFWESRIPELFADQEYDFFVGKASYIEKPEARYWDVVLRSHNYVDSVLVIEKSLSRQFPPDRQYCFDERLGQMVRTQCREYAAAYHRRLAGQVEDRMRQAILTVGSAWYSAWVDAGQPDLSNLGEYTATEAERRQQEAEDAARRQGKILGRPHEN